MSSTLPTGRAFSWLTRTDITNLYKRQVSSHLRLINSTEPDSALDSPENHNQRGGIEDVFRLAAILSTKLIKNHPFQDGNKRIAYAAAIEFLRRHNQLLPNMDGNEAGNREIALGHSRAAVQDLDISIAELAKLYSEFAVLKASE